MMTSRSFIVLVSISLLMLASGWEGIVLGDEKKPAPKEGDACKVTSGDNAGKVGKYTEGTKWCEGTWGGTECANPDPNGPSRCSPARTTPPFTEGERAMWLAYVEAIAPDAKPGAVEAWETKYKAKILKGTGAHVTVKLPTKTVTFDSSNEGLTQLFRKGSY